MPLYRLHGSQKVVISINRVASPKSTATHLGLGGPPSRPLLAPPPAAAAPLRLLPALVSADEAPPALLSAMRLTSGAVLITYAYRGPSRRSSRVLTDRNRVGDCKTRAL
jgi:hypothetical protein